MSSLPTIRDRRSLVQEWIRRFLSYTDEVTWFGPSSSTRAWAEATGALAEGAYLLVVAILKRITLMASSGEPLIQTATERGTPPLKKQASKLLVVISPETANVTAITIGVTDLIEVDDSSAFEVGDEIRIRDHQGVSELKTIIDITTGTGPGGFDELEVSTLTGGYDPTNDDVDVLFRAEVPAGTQIATSTGVVFETLEIVYTSDANSLLDGEGTFVGLADKVWCECTTKGATGNIEPLSVTGLVTPINGVRTAFNPEHGTGGLDVESDFDLKYRAMHRPSLSNQETHSWIESLAREGNSDVLRAIKVTSSTVATMSAKVLHRNGGVFSGAQLAALMAFVNQRVRSHMSVNLENVTMTSIEVEATITLDPNTTLEQVGKRASSSLAAFLDYRKWEFGVSPDEADLLALVLATDGVGSLETETFLPASEVAVASDSLPTLTRLSLRDATTGLTWNADLAVSF